MCIRDSEEDERPVVDPDEPTVGPIPKNDVFFVAPSWIAHCAATVRQEPDGDAASAADPFVPSTPLSTNTDRQWTPVECGHAPVCVHVVDWKYNEPITLPRLPPHTPYLTTWVSERDQKGEWVLEGPALYGRAQATYSTWAKSVSSIHEVATESCFQRLAGTMYAQSVRRRLRKTTFPVMLTMLLRFFLPSGTPRAFVFSARTRVPDFESQSISTPMYYLTTPLSTTGTPNYGSCSSVADSICQLTNSTWIGIQYFGSAYRTILVPPGAEPEGLLGCVVITPAPPAPRRIVAVASSKEVRPEVARIMAKDASAFSFAHEAERYNINTRYEPWADVPCHQGFAEITPEIKAWINKEKDKRDKLAEEARAEYDDVGTWDWGASLRHQ